MLPPKYRDHFLRGQYNDYRECHIEPDWLVIYFSNNKTIIFILNRHTC